MNINSVSMNNHIPQQSNVSNVAQKAEVKYTADDSKDTFDSSYSYVGDKSPVNKKDKMMKAAFFGGVGALGGAAGYGAASMFGLGAVGTTLAVAGGAVVGVPLAIAGVAMLAMAGSGNTPNWNSEI